MIRFIISLCALALICVVSGWAASSAPAAKPSFDCRKAKTDIEKQICAVPEYAALDRDITTMLARALKMLPPAGAAKLKAAQRRRLAERDACIGLIHGDPVVFAEVNSRIREQLEKRAKELKAILAAGKLSDET